jgi:hypothetical protein
VNLPSIVCPLEGTLLNSFHERTVVVRINDPKQIAEAAAQVRESGNSLVGVIIDSATPFDRVEFGENLPDVPIAVMAPAWGKFRRLAGRLNQLRELDLQVYLPADNPDNLVGLRVLSSVGIPACAVLGDGPKNWEALADLMTFAVLERTPHAAIEPFAFIASHYDPSSPCEWESIYFDDPRHFLHLDVRGRVALSYAELLEQRFIAQSISEIGSEKATLAIRERLQDWRRFFLNNHPCASCRGWRICRGRFAEELPQNQGCAAFFEEMLEVARQYQAHRNKVDGERMWPR